MNSHSLYFCRELYTRMLAFSLLLATPAIPAPTTVGCPENPVDVPADVPPTGVSIEILVERLVLPAADGFSPATEPGAPVDPVAPGAVRTESTNMPLGAIWIRRHSWVPVMGSVQRLRRKRIWLVFSRSSRRLG